MPATTDEPGLRAALLAKIEDEWCERSKSGLLCERHDRALFPTLSPHCNGWAVQIEALLRAALSTPAANDGSLDVAWAAAEAALPEGWVFWDMSRYRNGHVVVRVRLVNAPPSVVPEVYADGSTPAAALNALLARLSESPSEGKTE